MNKNEAYEQFSKWYEDCLESGIDPSEIVSEMGGMALITNEDIVEKLKNHGVI